jgi:hypothetical protein
LPATCLHVLVNCMLNLSDSPQLTNTPKKNLPLLS